MTAIDLVADLMRAEREAADRYGQILARLDQLEGNDTPMTIPQFAKRCQCSEDTVRSAVADGRLRFIDLGDRTIRIPATELAGRFVAEQPARSGRHLGVAS
jgi:excisionase family DNA binding protein